MKIDEVVDCIQSLNDAMLQSGVEPKYAYMSEAMFKKIHDECFKKCDTHGIIDEFMGLKLIVDPNMDPMHIVVSSTRITT